MRIDERGREISLPVLPSECAHALLRLGLCREKGGCLRAYLSKAY